MANENHFQSLTRLSVPGWSRMAAVGASRFQVIMFFMWIMVMATFILQISSKMIHEHRHGLKSQPEHVFERLEGHRVSETCQNTSFRITRNSLHNERTRADCTMLKKRYTSEHPTN